MEGIGPLTRATHDTQDFRATRFGGFIRLQYQRGRTFGHDETVPGFGKRLGRALRVFVVGGKSGQQVKTDHHFLANFTVGADTKSSICVATTYRLDAQLHRGRAGGAGGCQ